MTHAITTHGLSRREIEQRIPSALAVLIVAALGLLLGVHVGVSVNGAVPGDDSMARLLIWAVYPGLAAAIAVRSRAEVLVTGVAAVVPVAAFAVIYGADAIRSMGIGVPLGYGALLLLGVSVASRFARRPGLRWTVVALVAGFGAIVAAFVAVVLVISVMPITSAPRL